jgi:DNA polymerase (family X)
MSTNADLSRIFLEMAKVLDLTGANVFRVNAHKNVARVLDSLTVDVADLVADPAKLTAIDGIGEGSAKKIIEFVKTGRVREHDALLADIPAGLLQVMEIPGLGPKTVKLLWEQAGVVDIPSLKAAIEAGKLDGVPRMGAKTIANIKESLAFAAHASERMRLGEALPLAERIVASLRGLPGAGIKQVEYAGSLRRGKETVGDIDILATTSNPAAVIAAFRTMPGVIKVLAAGETKCSVRMEPGVQVDLRVLDDASFGAALMYFTGSKEHNVALRERAIKRGLRLNDYGLFPDVAPGKGADDRPIHQRGVKAVASRTEADIYKALDLPWIPPTLREARGELDSPLPSVLQLEDIKAELHAHTTASDGLLSIEQLARLALARGYHTIAVTDHSKSSVQANGLSPDRLNAHIDEVRAVAGRIKGSTILAGSEVDILVDGRLDYDDDLLAQLDVVVASPHVSLKQAPNVATKRLLAALRHPLVHILGHPTGRLINRREGLAPDMNALIEAAVEHDKALEINAHFYRLDLRDTHVKSAVQGGALIAINTDAHIEADFDNLRYGVLTAQRGWLTADRCINTWPKAKLHNWLKKKR